MGHIVSHEGVKVDQCKIKAITEWPIPKILSLFSGFIELTKYYCKFVRNYASIAVPVMTLLKRNSFEWNLSKSTY